MISPELDQSWKALSGAGLWADQQVFIAAIILNPFYQTKPFAHSLS